MFCSFRLLFCETQITKEKSRRKRTVAPNCDCKLFNIQNPAKQVSSVCDINKFINYVFSEKYASNGKIKLFKELGFNIEDSEYLKQEFDRQARECYLNGNYELGRLNEHGQQINITIKLQSKIRNNIELVTGWMIRPLGKITCNTPLGG